MVGVSKADVLVCSFRKKKLGMETKLKLATW